MTCPACADLIPDCFMCGGNKPAPVVERKATESNPMVRFRDGKQTRSAAIKAMCAHCMGCTYTAIEPGFRASVRDCTSTGCPLHQFRPFQRNDNDEGDEG